jgi:DNA segregation ATPase FtsK/SpoIIIE, S-DNA-T family
MSNWWKRFFGLEDEEGESRFPTNERVREEGRRTSKGRFEDPSRQIDVKVLHQYPNQNSFDQRNSQSQRYSATERLRESRGGQETRPKRNERDERPAYIRRSQREDVNPPFEKRVDKQRSVTGNQVDKKESTPPQRRARFAPTTVASPVFGYRARPIPQSDKSKRDNEETPPLRERESMIPVEISSFKTSPSEISKSYIEETPPTRERESVTRVELPSFEVSPPVISRSLIEETPPVRERESVTRVELPSFEVSPPVISRSLIEETPPVRERESVTSVEPPSFNMSTPEIGRGRSHFEMNQKPVDSHVPFTGIEKDRHPLTENKEALPIVESVSPEKDSEADSPKSVIFPVKKEEEHSSKNEQGLVEKTNDLPVNRQENRLLSIPKTETSVLRETPRKSAIPYNVMMTRSDQVAIKTPEKPPARRLSLGLLNTAAAPASEDDMDWIEQKKAELSESLDNFNVRADVLSHVQGPTVTRFEIRLHPGVKVNKVIGLTEDLKLTLSAKQIRIAPVPGKNTVGIEIPNQTRKPVFLKSLLQSTAYQEARSPLTAVLGQDITGQHVVTDLAKMPHGLIAGATGSGKSVCIHSLILSLIYKASPEELRLILIDPKVVELATYREMPHLAAPVITQPREAALALKWAVNEMERRYQLFADTGVRDLSRYNELIQDGKAQGEKIPYIVIIIDELADLMMTSPQDVEAAICRIAQKARAAGIHMLLATQRPSVDVITGLIKSNIPTRIAFGVSAQADSRTILDMSGAERLLGQGDMLFSENGSRSLRRLQGTFVTDEEIERITETFHHLDGPEYLFDVSDLQEKQAWDEEEDDLFEEAGYFVIEQGHASVSSLQRRFRIGYNRAARLVDQLEAASIITEANGSKPRQVLVDRGTFEQAYVSGEKTQI